MITLVIPEASPSFNENKWKNWSHDLKQRKHWSMLVLVAKNEAKVYSQNPIDPAAVRIIREGHRLLDHDNFVGGTKSLVDSLREQRLIVDDTAIHLTVTYEQKQIRKTDYPRTVVEIKRGFSDA